LVFSVREAAWPLIRTDLHLSYVQIGLVLTIPNLVAAVVEPSFGLLADAGKRRTLVLAGGLAFMACIGLLSGVWGFASLLAVSVVLYLASGAFVSLSQATLMDLDPDGHERSMVRWVLAGYVGVLVGPLALAGAATLGLGWRGVMLAISVAGLPLVARARRLPFGEGEDGVGFRAALKGAVARLRQGRVIRWLVLLELSDLMGDTLFGYLALYLVDVVRVRPIDAALAVAIWSGAGLAGNAILLPALKRVPGIRALRATAAAAAVAFPLFLLIPSVAAKLALLALVGTVASGWYPILMGRLFTELRGSSGTAVALADVGGLIGLSFPLLLGALAERFGLGFAMWLLLLAPATLLVGLPR
jgi:FSR family fosmidomycin resistance protein-like MFS transporter